MSSNPEDVHDGHCSVWESVDEHGLQESLGIVESPAPRRYTAHMQHKGLNLKIHKNTMK